MIRLTIYKEGKLITATSFRDNQLAETRDRYAYAKELYSEPSSLYRVQKWSSTTPASPSVRRLRLLAASYLRDWYRPSHLPFSNDQRKNRLVVRCMFSFGIRWINTKACPPSSWSVYGQPVRTNNDIEGWHNSLNRRAGGRVHLPFYLLIQLLHRESSVCTVQVRLVNARKLQRIQRKKYRALQAWIFGYWEDYTASKISSRQLLKACSHLAHGPLRTD